MAYHTEDTNRPIIEILEETLPVYQRGLSLVDWDIVLVVNSDPAPNNVAETWWDNVPKLSRICFDPQRAWVERRPHLEEYNIKQTLLHELMHLVFADANHDPFTDILTQAGAIGPELRNAIRTYTDWTVDTLADHLYRSGVLEEVK